MNNYLSVDPSGSGTTGCVFYQTQKKTYQFFSFTSKNWQEHFSRLRQLCEEKQVTVLVYENTNFIYSRQFAGSVSLLKLIGAIESLKYPFSFLRQIDNVLVKQVKDFYRKVIQGTVIVPQLERKIGRGGGWFFAQEKINLHQLDALLLLKVYLAQKKKSVNGAL